MSNEQTHLDTRALEIASELKGSVNMMNQILKSHLDDCIDERRIATQTRKDFRAETDSNFSALRSVMQVMHTENRRRLDTVVYVLLGIVATGLLALVLDKLGWVRLS